MPLRRPGPDNRLRSTQNIRCNGCICDQLRRLSVNTELDVFLASGIILEDVVFLKFNRNNCCASFRDTEEEPGTTIIVDCRDIQAIRIE